MNQDTNQDPTDQDIEEEAEFILSVCWDSGVLSAICYNLSTLELHVRLSSRSYVDVL